MRPTELVVGNCYFNVAYRDADLLVPSVLTLTYEGVGEDLENGRRAWMFRDGAAAGPDDAEDDAGFAFSDEQLYGVVDLAGLIRILGELTADHPLHPLPPQPEPATEAALAELRSQIARFLETRELQGITVTIAFTDDGVSLSRRREGTVDLVLFAHPRLDPDEESRLRAVCSEAGLAPTEDYLSDGGRTRVLAYPVSSLDPASLFAVLARIFLESYAMRQGDVLTYHVTPGGIAQR